MSDGSRAGRSAFARLRGAPLSASYVSMGQRYVFITVLPLLHDRVTHSSPRAPDAGIKRPEVVCFRRLVADEIAKSQPRKRNCESLNLLARV